MSESPADRRSEEYASVLCRLLEEQDDEMEQRVWQSLYEVTIKIADARGWPIERHGDIGDVALSWGIA